MLEFALWDNNSENETGNFSVLLSLICSLSQPPLIARENDWERQKALM